MPFDKNGPCPFHGDHWPPTWPDKTSITPKTFSSLSDRQRLDFIEYYYERESKKRKASSQPECRFPLEKLKAYFGQHKTRYGQVVLGSAEYKAYAKERSRPPPPPEMSLLTRVLIAFCCTLAPPPPQTAEARAKSWEEEQMWLPEQVVRELDRAREGIHTSKSGLPDKDGNYKDGDYEDKVLEFDKDPNRILVCNMQHTIASAATRQFGADWRGQGGSAGEEDQAIWKELVEAEMRDVKSEEADRNRTKYVARAVLGLIQLLASVLRYLFALQGFSLRLARVVMGRFLDSWIPVFQEHQTGIRRNGTNQRLQCQGDDWDASVEAFLKSRKQMPKKQKTEQQQLQTTEAKKLERKLQIALNCAKSLVDSTNTAIHNSCVLKSEPGCKQCSAELDMKNTSLLLSTLDELPRCLGTNDRSRRFESPRMAPEGSAPDAGGGPVGDAARAAGETAATAGDCPAPGQAPRRSRREPKPRPAGPAHGKVCGQVTHPLSLLADMHLRRLPRTRPRILMP